MKRLNILKKLAIIALFALLACISLAAAISAQGEAQKKEKKLTIIHTNDLHSHLLGFAPNIDYTPAATGNDSTVGGFARIATAIKETKKARSNPCLVLDGGDFLMGSLFHMISREYALELRLMKDMGYDAVALGNHEFDLKPHGLARIIRSGKEKGKIPQLLLANMVFDKKSDKDDTLEQVFSEGLIKPYMILKKEGLKIGIFGLMGKEAAEVAPFSKPVTFSDPVKKAAEIVEILRSKEKADIIICISHSGIWKEKSISEDEILAKEVGDIDVIVSAHTHSLLTEPITVGKTSIVQAGYSGQYVGVLDLVVENKKIRVSQYKAVKIDDSIPGDAAITGKINLYKSAINMKVLKFHGLGFDTPVAETAFDLIKTRSESNLGNFIADSVMWNANRYVYDPADPETRVVVALESHGIIRDSLMKGKTGKIAAADLFRCVPLGIGADDSPGYPLAAAYVYAGEIKDMLEVLTTVSPVKGDQFFLQVSGIKFKYNPNRMMFDRVTEIRMGNEKDGYTPLDYSTANKKLYRMAGNIYNAAFFSMMGGFTYDLLAVVPKDRNGNPIKKVYDLRIDADKEKPGVQELKEWVGVFDYIRSFRDTNGNKLPEMPEKYRGTDGRIVVEASWNPVSLLKKGTFITWAVFGVFCLGTILFLLIVRFIVKKIRKKRN
ncbi:MAG: bifunctional metallophosphatase/5'-nucleotidase [bacterium]|nr:bifunctional metallophosphatase/5'-nucleotidase [bacterium]